MLRAKPTLWCALGASLGAACVGPDAPSTADDAPLIGRLQTREGLTDLTVDSFLDSPNAVPRNAYARVIADIDKDVRTDLRKAEEASANEMDFTRKREF